MELIDKNKLLNENYCDHCPYQESKSCDENCERMGRNILATRRMIEDAPVVDVVPVVRGEWKKIHSVSVGLLFRNSEEFTESQCSVCGRWTMRLTRCINDYYCPNCGADMRGEDR